jgi:hypothetical protein
MCPSSPKESILWGTMVLQKNQFCEVPWGPGAGHWVNNGIVWPIPCGISKAFKSCFPNPGPAVISPVLQSATLILCALQMVDSFHAPQDPLGKTYPWTHLDTQTTILEQGTVASVAMESWFGQGSTFCTSKINSSIIVSSPLLR